MVSVPLGEWKRQRGRARNGTDGMPVRNKPLTEGSTE